MSEELYSLSRVFEDAEGNLHRTVVSRIRNDLGRNIELLITKDDVIFICKEPLKKENA